MKTENFSVGEERELFNVYRKAFHGFPWFEDLSEEEVRKRWSENISFPGFCCLVYKIDGQVVGAIWWDEISQDRLRQERGNILADLVQSKFHYFYCIWERDLIVDPDFQNRGIGTKLRLAFLSELKQNQRETLILTRMRQDNKPTLKIAQKLNYKPTGIKVPCSIVSGIFHEYWSLLLGSGSK